MIEKELNRRIFEGYEKPLVYKGQLTKDADGKVVTIRTKEPNDLYFRAKRLEPAYKDNYDARPSGREFPVLSITFNLHPGVAPPAPEPAQVVDGDTVELSDGATEPGPRN